MRRAGRLVHCRGIEYYTEASSDFNRRDPHGMAPDPQQPVHIVVNPHSGYGDGQIRLAEMQAAAHRAGLHVVTHTTRGPDDATEYAQSVVGEAGAIIVWGGDGTAREVATGLLGSDVPMLACPVGTENLLAKELGMPSSPAQVLEVLRTGQVADCDVGTVNGETFLCLISVGFDAEVVRRLSARRSGHISHLTYFWPLWRTFWEHDFPRLRVAVDGREIFADRGLAFVGNISRYAVGLRICRDAAIDDGLLDLVVFPCREQSGLILNAAWTLLRLHPWKGNVVYRRVRSARIEAEGDTPSQVDGDVGPPAPLDIGMANGRVRLIVPNPPGGGVHRSLSIQQGTRG
jgi:diacylglycerol kinase (ATP)